MKPRELEPFTDRITYGLTRYSNTKAVTAALQLASELLEFKPRYGFTKEYAMQEHMQALKATGVTPMSLLQRVCEFYAYAEWNPQRFHTVREEEHALARAVLWLRNQGTQRSTTHLLLQIGGTVREILGVFPLAFVRRLEADDRERAKLLDQLTDFSPASP